jgi:hypothetical protein
MQWFLDRLGEASTWNAVAVACVTLGQAIPGVPGQILTWGGGSLGALLGIVIPEAKRT